MKKKITDVICYLTIVGWLIAYIAGDRKNCLVHLNNALVVLAIQAAADFVGRRVSFAPANMVLTVINYAAWILCIYGIILAMQGKDQELPLVGGIKLVQ